jgi:hypothetical protein
VSPTGSRWHQTPPPAELLPAAVDEQQHLLVAELVRPGVQLVHQLRRRGGLTGRQVTGHPVDVRAVQIEHVREHREPVWLGHRPPSLPARHRLLPHTDPTAKLELVQTQLLASDLDRLADQRSVPVVGSARALPASDVRRACQRGRQPDRPAANAPRPRRSGGRADPIRSLLPGRERGRGRDVPVSLATARRQRRRALAHQCAACGRLWALRLVEHPVGSVVVYRHCAVVRGVDAGPAPRGGTPGRPRAAVTVQRTSCRASVVQPWSEPWLRQPDVAPEAAPAAPHLARRPSRCSTDA